MKSGCFKGQVSCPSGSLPAGLPQAVFLQQMGDKRGCQQQHTPTMEPFKSCFHSCKVLCVPSVIRAARSCCSPVTQLLFLYQRERCFSTKTKSSVSGCEVKARCDLVSGLGGFQGQPGGCRRGAPGALGTSGDSHSSHHCQLSPRAQDRAWQHKTAAPKVALMPGSGTVLPALGQPQSLAELPLGTQLLCQ